MVTIVGTQEDFMVALKGLVELEYASIEAYNAAIQKIQNSKFKLKLKEFKVQHDKHIEVLTKYLESFDYNPPRTMGFGQTMTVDHTLISDLNNDESILKALLSIEDDSNNAYERMNGHINKNNEIAYALKINWQNEIIHKEWIESTIKDMIST